MTQPDFNGLFAAVLASAKIIGMGGADVTLSVLDYCGTPQDPRLALKVTGVGRADAVLNLPAKAFSAIWAADRTNAYPVTVKVGTGSVSIEPDQVVVIVTDGSENGISGLEVLGAVSTMAWKRIGAADSPYQALAGDHLDIDSSAGAVTVLLPAEPATFDEVWFSNLKGTLAAHALTVTPGEGDTIAGDAGLTASTNGAEFSLRFDGVTNWTFQLKQ